MGNKELKKVRVVFKDPIDRKTSSMFMKEELIKWHRSPKGKGMSPYKRITLIR